ncbi:MAG TPA: polysaccharide deacetylase family protein [Acetobacteraceae bacterium]
MIDTEEDFDWNGPFSRTNTSVESFRHINRAQALFEKHGVRPCYLSSYPVLMDDEAARTLRGWVENGQCVIGAHLHPWVTPPHEEVVCLVNSFPCNLPEDLERRKLQTLSDTALDRIGQRPTVYKAGRYGFRVERGGTLTSLGFEVDTSVLPFRDLSGLGGGPDFFECPSQPFWADPTRRLLHVPMTHGLIGPLRTLAGSGADRFLFSTQMRRLRVPGLLSHLGLLERIMLTPEGLLLDDMRRLVRELASAGQMVFALTMHSPSFAPGHTPYARDANEVEALLARLDGFLSFFHAELNGVSVTPGELKAALS